MKTLWPIRRGFRRAAPDKSLELMQRPFTDADLAPAPADWAPAPPGFVGVGCGKSGSGWWYRLIAAHPQVAPNRLDTKELQYFYHFGYGGIGPEAVRMYHRAFAAPAGRACGEWSPGYLAYPLALDGLAAAAPEARILVIVRNPIDRTLSAINQMLSARLPFLRLRGARRELYVRFSLFPEAVRDSALCLPFARLFARFDPGRVLVLQYERCRADPAAALRTTYAFLGLDEDFVPDNVAAPVHRLPYRVPALQPEERRRLAAWFKPDVERFVSEFGLIDLDYWPEFARG